ncbi:MAG TPA: hypothetical protein VFW62_13520 [bacterium]|nr:hypothetical protein [bacterium]
MAAGGEFWPHVTHQNGLSVDFMVPVRNEQGEPLDFPGRVWNRLGYDLEFDAEGRIPGYRIDFEALAEHLFELHRAAKREGIGIRLVIFDPELTARLFETRRGPYLAKHVRFLRRPARWRHDEHYHVDFKVPCSSGVSHWLPPRTHQIPRLSLLAKDTGALILAFTVTP